MFDFYLHNHSIGRFILYLKSSKKKFNYTDIMQFKNLVFLFDIKEVKEINSISVLNSIYFFKYYFGVLPISKNYKYNFRLNYNYYSFILAFNCYKKNIYYTLNFLSNDVVNVMNRSSIEVKKLNNLWIYVIKDMNFFIEKKNSIGFFNLKHEITFELYGKGLDNFVFSDSFMLFKSKI